MSEEGKVVVLACSGIGKVLGSITRLALYHVIDEMRREGTATTCLPMVALKDKEAVALVRKHPCITIDGCPNKCAKVSVENAGASTVKAFTVAEFMRMFKDLKPSTVSVLEPGSGGRALARKIAEQLSIEVDKLSNKDI
ncbi:MAG: putative zinc-binding protein [Candidatus Atabeyarchaeum deiterrae]